MTVMSSSKVLGSLAKSDLQQHSRTGEQLRSIPGRDRLGSKNFIPSSRAQQIPFTILSGHAASAKLSMTLFM